jgi:hypothetical protein
MTVSRIVLTALCAVSLAACGKKPADEVPAATSDSSSVATTPSSAGAAVSTPAASANPADSTDAQREAATKQAALDFATQEDRYINDAGAQWAANAIASSTFGDERGKEPAQSNLATNAVGAADGTSWSNNKQDMGFDWLEASFAKPVNATEVRVVFTGGDGVEAISKIELQDVGGAWNTVWSGISDVKRDRRGRRTWFVKTFPATAYKAKGVKITIANNVEQGYKVIDAVQLVGK